MPGARGLDDAGAGGFGDLELKDLMAERTAARGKSKTVAGRQSHGRPTKAPPDERGGNRHGRPNTTAPHPDSTDLSRPIAGTRMVGIGASRSLRSVAAKVA